MGWSHQDDAARLSDQYQKDTLWLLTQKSISDSGAPNITQGGSSSPSGFPSLLSSHSLAEFQKAMPALKVRRPERNPIIGSLPTEVGETRDFEPWSHRVHRQLSMIQPRPMGGPTRYGPRPCVSNPASTCAYTASQTAAAYTRTPSHPQVLETSPRARSSTASATAPRKPWACVLTGAPLHSQARVACPGAGRSCSRRRPVWKRLTSSSPVAQGCADEVAISRNGSTTSIPDRGPCCTQPARVILSLWRQSERSALVPCARSMRSCSAFDISTTR